MRRSVLVVSALAVSLSGLFAFDFTSSQKRWWAIQPVVAPKIPSVKNHNWIKTPIDAFVLSKLESEGIAPSSEANKVTLLKRATEDMLGLPPTQDEIQAFVNDSAPDAWDKVVDRLLASPQYGERWGRHWLDLARYADSSGFHNDLDRPHRSEERRVGKECRSRWSPYH